MCTVMDGRAGSRRIAANLRPPTPYTTPVPRPAPSFSIYIITNQSGRTRSTSSPFAPRARADRRTPTHALAGARPDRARPDRARPDRARPDRARPDRARPDRARPDRVRRPTRWPEHAPTEHAPTVYADTRAGRSTPRPSTPQPSMPPTEHAPPSCTRARRATSQSCHGVTRASCSSSVRLSERSIGTERRAYGFRFRKMERS